VLCSLSAWTPTHSVNLLFAQIDATLLQRGRAALLDGVLLREFWSERDKLQIHARVVGALPSTEAQMAVDHVTQ
jgi:hypothetical protein